MNVYLDNSATTRPFDEVTEYMAKIMRENYGNPSSMHMAGVDAEREIRTAKETLSSIMKVDAKEIYFTSGGTESDNLAIIGCANAYRREGMHLITTKVEHPAVLETMKYLEEQGFSVTYLDTKKDGTIDPDTLKAALTDDTIMVSIMHVNNEIGAVNDIEKVAGVVKGYRPSILFHTDAVQSFGKYRITPARSAIDLVSVSSHKIHGPKGMGALYINDKIKIRPILFGGGQQKGIRSGTENVPGIAGLGLAAKLVYDGLEEKVSKLYEMKVFFIEELKKIPDVSINGIPDRSETVEAIRSSAPHIVSASFAGIRAEVLLHALEDKGIYVSSGSACSTNKPSVSATLSAIGLDRSLLDSTLRFSFSTQTTKEELEYTLSTLADVLPMLRRYSRR